MASDTQVAAVRRRKLRLEYLWEDSEFKDGLSIFFALKIDSCLFS
jgi:hypothetical protein